MKQICYLYLVLDFQYTDNQIYQYIFFFSSFASKGLECFPSIAEFPAKIYCLALFLEEELTLSRLLAMVKHQT